MSNTRGTSGGLPSARSPAQAPGEQSARLVVTHPRDPGWVGKQLLVSSLGFSVGTRADDLAVPGAADTAAVIQCQATDAAEPVWTLEAMRREVEINEAEVQGTQPLATGERIRVLGYHFVFISGADLEQQFHEVIYQLTIRDFATGLHNARFLVEMMDWQRRHVATGGEQRSVGVVQLEPCLQPANDEIARANDDSMRTFARHIRARAPKDWTLARLADGELGVIAREASAAALELRLREICSEFTSQSEEPRRLSSVCGATDWEASANPADLLEQARARCRQPAA